MHETLHLISTTAPCALILQTSTQRLREMPHIWAVPEFRREFQKDSSLGPRTMFFVHLPYHFIFQCVLNYSFKFKWSSPTARILQVKRPFSLKSDCLEINKKNELKLNFCFCLKEDKKIKPASTNSIFAFNGWDQNTFLENKNQKWFFLVIPLV